jgi:uncharacterized membrane protein YfcA
MSEAVTLLLTFAVGFVATFAFVTTGGVGMITTPALVFLGLSPQAAIATDIFALLGGRLGGLLGLRREGKLDLALGLRLGAIAALGAVGGALTLLSLSETLVKRLLSGFLLVLLALVLVRPHMGVATGQPLSASRRRLGMLLFVPVGFWATLIGAGFLNLGSAVLLFVLRKSFLETAAVLTVVGLAVGLTGLVIFGSRGTIVWPLGFAMLAGKLAGGYFGARYAVKVGEARIRWLFIAVVFASAVQLWLA